MKLLSLIMVGCFTFALTAKTENASCDGSCSLYNDLYGCRDGGFAADDRIIKIPKEFKIPDAGAEITLDLVGRRPVKGKLLEVTPDKVYIEVEGLLKLGFVRKDISDRSRWMFFKPDFEKLLAEQKHEEQRLNALKASGVNLDELPEHKLKSKLHTIVIPKIDFEDITIPEAVEWLREECRRRDPEGVGINIKLNIPPDDGYAVVNIILKNKTARYAMHFFCLATKLKCRVEKDSLIIERRKSSSN